MLLISDLYLKTLRKLYAKLGKSKISWAITGSLGFALHGMQIEIHDIDIQTDKKGSYSIERLFSEYIVKKVSYRISEQIRSYYGSFVLEDVVIEIMGDIQKKLKNNTWEDPVNVEDHLEIIDFKDMKLPVLSLEYEEKAYRQLGRIKKAELIHKYIIENKETR